MLSVWPTDMTSEKHACPHRHSANTCPVNWDSECFIRTHGAQFRFHYMCERKFLRVQRDGKIAREVHSTRGKLKMLYIHDIIEEEHHKLDKCFMSHETCIKI